MGVSCSKYNYKSYNIHQLYGVINKETGNQYISVEYEIDQGFDKQISHKLKQQGNSHTQRYEKLVCYQKFRTSSISKKCMMEQDQISNYVVKSINNSSSHSSNQFYKAIQEYEYLQTFINHDETSDIKQEDVQLFDLYDEAFQLLESQKLSTISLPFSQSNSQLNIKSSQLETKSSHKVQLSQQIQNSKKHHSYMDKIGPILCTWFDTNTGKTFKSFGTGFAISSKIIVTCAHVVYNQTTKTVCNRAVFGLGHQAGPVLQQYCYYSAATNFIRMTLPPKNKNYNRKPLKEDIALIYLEKDLPEQQYLKLTSEPINSDQKLYLSGYPSNNVNFYTNFPYGQIKCNHLQGNFVQISHSDINDKNIIFTYDIDTTSGCSGSPLLMKKGEQFSVIGIHSHRGKQTYNQGIKLTESIIKTITQWAKELMNQAELRDNSKLQHFESDCDEQYQAVSKEIKPAIT